MISNHQLQRYLVLPVLTKICRPFSTLDELKTMRKQHKFQQNRQLLWEKLTGTKDKVWWQNMRERGQNVSTQLREARKLEDEKRKQDPEYTKLMELKAKSKNRKKKKIRKKSCTAATK